VASFLLVGDGFAAAKVANAVVSTPDARLVAMAATRPPADGRFRTARGEAVEVVAADLLRRAEGLAWARAVNADWLLCINTTLILPAALLDLYDGRALNSHPGPLPDYAGLHAHQWAIRHGRSEYGATVHRMAPRVDAGPILAASRFPIHADDTGLTLFRRALGAAADLLAGVVAKIAAGEALAETPQDLSRRRVWRHAEALDGRIPWASPARAVVDFVRAGNYEPFASPTYVAAFQAPSGASVEVLRAVVGRATDRPPGALAALDEAGPHMACGDGLTVQLTRARDPLGLLDAAGWRRHFGASGG
jgi:methionyl-tRNA formyltransferase